MMSLADMGENPPLGQITKVLSRTVELHPEADERYGHRVDYRFWRARFSIMQEGRPPDPSFAEIEQHLLTGEPAAVWNWTALLGRIFRSNYRGDFTDGEWASLHGNCISLADKVGPIPGSEKACRLAQLLIVSDDRTLKYGETEIEQVECLEYFRKITALLQLIDEEWKPGYSIGLREVRASAQAIFTEDPIVPTQRIPEILLDAAMAAQNIVRKQRELRDESEALMDQALWFCLSAWRFLRDFRLGEELFREDKAVGTFKVDLNKIRGEEIFALQQLTYASWNAGKYLLFPMFAYYYLWNVEPNTKSQGFADMFAKWMHQSGLEMPPGFKNENKPSRPRFIYKRDYERPYWWRLAADQRTDPDWLVILDKYREWETHLSSDRRSIEGHDEDPFYYDPFQLFKGLAFAFENELYKNVEVAQSGFRLALRYGWTGMAEKFLPWFKPSKMDVMDFCHHLKRIQQVCPLGIDGSDDQHVAWRKALKDAWRRLSGTEKIYPHDRLVLHEVLVGRSVAISRGNGKKMASLFVKKYNDLASLEEVREVIVNGQGAFKRSTATVNPESMLELLKSSISDSVLGAPVSVSITRIGGDRLSILVFGCSAASGEGWLHETKVFEGLDEEWQAIIDMRLTWSNTNGQSSAEPAVPWGDSFVKLCGYISTLAKRVNPECRWMMLALDQDLAELPWQDLMRRYWGGRREIFVSLVPNFGWAKISYKDIEFFPKTADNKPNLSEEFPKFREIIERDLQARRLQSTCIVLGHGRHPDNSDFVVINAKSGDLGPEAFVEMGNYRTLMIHSCYGGHSGGGFLGDLGGIPALALSTGCRLVCAPVTEVPLSTAETLHRWHADARVQTPLEFGVRYMRALQEDPRVGLYTCYGFGNQFVRRPPERR